MSDKNGPLKRDALETTTAERLAAIVEAAERAATKVIDDAEEEARRYLAEARLEAGEILGRAERLLDGLSAARDRLQAELEVDGGAGAGVADALRPGPRSHLSAVPADEAEAAPAQPRQLREEGSAGARLLATQMAVSGNSREEIAARLRSGFEVEDAEAILDAILGPEER